MSSRQVILDANRNLDISDQNLEPILEAPVELPKSDRMADVDQIYKALRLLPEFDGNPHVLTRFISLCDRIVDEYSDKTKQTLGNVALLNGILNKVVGSAARLINANGIPNDWTGIRNALINNFADQRDETALYNDLALLTQGNSTPQEFYESCQNLFSTIMTYVALHETVDTTITAKRDLYKKLTLQAYLRGLKDPLGSSIRCMRPASIEQALEFVHEEMNTLYLQHRNQHLPEKKSMSQIMSGQPSQALRAPPNPSFTIPMMRPSNFNMQVPSRSHFMQPPPNQWKSNFHNAPQAGPSRTQQIFRAVPPNFNQQNNAFRMPPRNPPMNFNSGPHPRPMSGVSHFVPRNLPPTPQLSGHDWRKSGNPPPSNYFKTREMHFNDCYPYEPYYEEYYPDYDLGQESYGYPQYYQEQEQQYFPQEYQEYSQIAPGIPEVEQEPAQIKEDFQKDIASKRSK